MSGMWCLRDVDQTPMKIMAVIYTKFSRMQKKMMGMPGPVYLDKKKKKDYRKQHLP